MILDTTYVQTQQISQVVILIFLLSLQTALAGSNLITSKIDHSLISIDVQLILMIIINKHPCFVTPIESWSIP